MAGSRPVSIFIVVDLPQPLEPRKPKISPRPMVKLTRLTAVKLPNRLVRSVASMAGSPPGSTRGGITRARRPPSAAPGSSETNASSRFFVPVRSINWAGVPVAMTRPASMAIVQSKR